MVHFTCKNSISSLLHTQNIDYIPYISYVYFREKHFKKQKQTNKNFGPFKLNHKNHTVYPFINSFIHYNAIIKSIKWPFNLIIYKKNPLC